MGTQTSTSKPVRALLASWTHPFSKGDGLQVIQSFPPCCAVCVQRGCVLTTQAVICQVLIHQVPSAIPLLCLRGGTWISLGALLVHFVWEARFAGLTEVGESGNLSI